MGIQGLLPLLKDIQVKKHVSAFKGQAVGVDTYCWLHKGTYSCAKDLILGKPTRAYVHYVMKRVNMLKNYGVKPILVFDGGHLPAKKEKELERRRNREAYKKRGMEALREGRSQDAFELFQKACDVTPKMASEVIKECHSIGVQCIVAPYEADAQLAYLMIKNITQFTISEDSDLLLYGCNKVLYKMNSDGDGVLVDLANLNRVRSVQLSSFTFDKFRQMCMLSGCDYLPSIKGMGLKKAYQAIKKHRTAAQCIGFLKCSYSVPDDYAKNFEKSETVFKYQLVFDPIEKKIVPLNEIEETVELDSETLNFAGPKMSHEKALQIALGNVDPIRGEVLADLDDFAKEDSVEKSTQPEKNNNSAFQFRDTTVQKKQNNPPPPTQNELPPSPIIEIPSTDCTPTNIEKYEDMRPVSKCLDGVLASYTDATKSLKLLDDAEGLKKKSKLSPMKTLFGSNLNEKTATKPTSRSKSVWLVAKKPKHKYRNPFRIEEKSVETEKEVQSCYFSGQPNESLETSHCEASGDEGTDDIVNHEPLVFNTDTTIGKSRGAFIEYLDTHNVSMTTRKRLTLDRDDSSPKKDPGPRKKAKQRKLNNISSILSRYSNNLNSGKEIYETIDVDTIDNNEDKENKKDPVFILATPEKNPSLDNSDERIPLSPVVCNSFQRSNTSSQTSVDFDVVSSNIADVFITDTYPPPKDENVEKKPLTKNATKLPSMKIGLSKNCSNKPKSTSVLKITNMLETFKRFDKNALPTTIADKSSVSLEEESVSTQDDTPTQNEGQITPTEKIIENDVEIIYSDEEDVLPKERNITLKKIDVGRTFPEGRKMERCKSLGLSRKRRSKTSLLAKDDKKQTKLTLDKFKFERKSISVS